MEKIQSCGSQQLQGHRDQRRRRLQWLSCRRERGHEKEPSAPSCCSGVWDKCQNYSQKKKHNKPTGGWSEIYNVQAQMSIPFLFHSFIPFIFSAFAQWRPLSASRQRYSWTSKECVPSEMVLLCVIVRTTEEEQENSSDYFPFFCFFFFFFLRLQSTCTPKPPVGRSWV